MPFLDTAHQRAAVLLLLLGAALAIALSPFASGLISIPVLYVIFQPVHDRLARRLGPRVTAAIVVALALLVILVPGASFAGIVVAQAQQIAANVATSPILESISRLRIGRVDVGAQIANLGSTLVGWVGGSAFGLIGTATRLALNLTIALFGLYYLLLDPARVWNAVSSYIPFNDATTEHLRTRFRNVTTSTVIGTGLTAILQGTLVGLAFWGIGLPNGLFWGMVTAVFSILPVVGSGLVWGPAVLSLVLANRYAAAIALAAWGLVVVGNVDFVIRPMVFKRWAQIHPLTTLVGALAGVPYFGLLGLLIGPLALSYFLELVTVYHEDYILPETREMRAATASQAALKAVVVPAPVGPPDGAAISGGGAGGGSGGGSGGGVA